MGRPAAAKRDPYDAQALAELAMEVFAERGYDGASLEDIARAAKLAKSSIYHHVTGKEQLLALGLDRGIRGLFDVVDDVSKSDEPAIARLRYLIRRCVEGAIVDRAGVTVWLSLKGDTETERWARQRLADFTQWMQGLVAEAVDEGSVRPGLDSGDVTRLLLGIVSSLTTWYSADELDVDRLQSAIDLIAFEGVTTVASRRRGRGRGTFAQKVVSLRP